MASWLHGRSEAAYQGPLPRFVLWGATRAGDVQVGSEEDRWWQRRLRRRRLSDPLENARAALRMYSGPERWHVHVGAWPPRGTVLLGERGAERVLGERDLSMGDLLDLIAWEWPS